ncbi:MAG: Cys-tRNA(Pro) deacylase [Baileyella intestinalis]|uniref:Cys-tRNA(Pro)/Cys-tRNA(Cys) deacylase n=1 Tax=Baileyella intestinalis TaxID=2606709 RepID=A0A6A8MC46_9FIRM|nr:Cys-tRNA(Pro) deacylase [Baileyella intestinalis]MCI7686249.1 Cys-tRNA(Pro) deacylase [Clostridiales bacterium]MDY2994933.1 Cys-tRNA(Pro) deacylase [Baileyella intestinalis]MST69037.1 Cys-tRNA(Pro) deacylase [Baileyella intestinalis]
MEKTNAMRMLDQSNIPYETGEYEYDESDLSGDHVADYLGISKEEIFKTLVTRGNDNELYVFVVPVSGELDLKKAAAAAGVKKVEMIHVKEIFNLTGYLRGGCSPIGMKKQYPTFIDETAILFDKIYISGGKRGLQIIIDPQVLADFTGAKLVDIGKE